MNVYLANVRFHDAPAEARMVEVKPRATSIAAATSKAVRKAIAETKLADYQLRNITVSVSLIEAGVRGRAGI